eukprot:677414-Amphidinium_carterae.2
MGLYKDARATRWQKCPLCNRVLKSSPSRTDGLKRCWNRLCCSYGRTSKQKSQCTSTKQSAIDLREQALLAFNFALGLLQYQSVLQAGCNHKAVERLYGMIRQRLACYVRSKQEGIVFNDTPEWVDCEADEVSVRKRKNDEDQTIWTEYLGIVRRGYPSTCLLYTSDAADDTPCVDL